MAEQPDNIVLEHLRGLRRDIGDIKGDVQTLKAELRSQREEMATKSDLHSLRADVASDMLRCRRTPASRSSAFAGLWSNIIPQSLDTDSSSANSRSGFAGWSSI